MFNIDAEPNKISRAATLGGIDLYLGWVSDHSQYGYDAKYKEPIKGTVIARQCDYCGHHEIGITTDADEYVTLKPGMKIVVHE